MQTQRAQLLGTGFQTLDVLFRQIDDIRYEQHLGGHFVFRQGCFQPFIDQPFVGRMLIHNHQAIFCLGNNVVFVDLRARCPQRQACVLLIEPGVLHGPCIC